MRSQSIRTFEIALIVVIAWAIFPSATIAIENDADSLTTSISDIQKRAPRMGHSADDKSQVMAARIDELIHKRLTEARVTPAPLANDAQFMRRAYLDLMGRNPDPVDIVAYVDDKNPNKRLQLVQKLVGSQGISARLADVWTDLLLPENDDSDPGGIGRDSLRRWMQRRFSENQRYDRIVSDLLIARGNSADQPTAFFLSLNLKPEKLAEKTSRIFLGVTLDCAQCHDHPFAPWKQTDFWSLAAYFAQLKSNDNGSPNMRNTAGIVDSDEGEVTLPETTTIVTPRSLVPGIESKIESGSRRQQLVIWLTSRENKWFARAAVNRFWSLLMGRGLVEPVDDVGTKSLTSHQELMEELSNFFTQERFDVRSLLLAIAMTDAYARDSNHPNKFESIDPQWYAVMPPKPLTSRQLANSLRQTARQPTPAAGTIDTWTQLAQQLGKVRGEGVEYTGGVLQALMTQHGSSMEVIWSDAQSRMLEALAAPHLGPHEQVRWMFLATLGREPSSQEYQLISASLPTEQGLPIDQGPPTEGARSSKLREWQSDLLWAMVNSTEFAMTP